MEFHHHEGLRYLTFDIFPPEVVHAVFTRRGGLSPAPWRSLNLGSSVGDERARVLENRLRAFHALGRKADSMFDVWLVHSADVVLANAPHPKTGAPTELRADAIITDNPAVTLFMRFADCTPILLYDPRQGAVGIVHAGWLGTLRGIATETVKAMQAAFGSRPADLLAAIGPAIGPDHYEVGPDVEAQVRQTFAEEAEALLPRGYGPKAHFDLWAANRRNLERAGVEQVQLAGLCTACHPEDWFSHRAEHGKTGRFGAAIALA